MRSLITLIRRWGLRRAVQIWKMRQVIALDDATFRAKPEFRPFHGEKPRLTGYRRRSR